MKSANALHLRHSFMQFDLAQPGLVPVPNGRLKSCKKPLSERDAFSRVSITPEVSVRVQDEMARVQQSLKLQESNRRGVKEKHQKRVHFWRNAFVETGKGTAFQYALSLGFQFFHISTHKGLARFLVYFLPFNVKATAILGAVLVGVAIFAACKVVSCDTEIDTLRRYLAEIERRHEAARSHGLYTEVSPPEDDAVVELFRMKDLDPETVVVLETSASPRQGADAPQQAA